MLARTPGATLARQRASGKPAPLAAKPGQFAQVSRAGVSGQFAPKPRIVHGARGYAPPPSDTAPLPDAVLKALRSIVADMRSLPRDVITDRGELVHWVNRMAGRVDGVAKLRVAFTPPPPKRSPVAPQGAPASQGAPARDDANLRYPLSPLAAAEAVFAKGLKTSEALGEGLQSLKTPDPSPEAGAGGTYNIRTPRRRDEVRTVTSRKGKAVPVQIRRAREAGQIEMML